MFPPFIDSFGDQFYAVMVNMVGSVLTGMFTAVLAAFVTSFVTPLFKAIAAALGVPA